MQPLIMSNYTLDPMTELQTAESGLLMDTQPHLTRFILVIYAFIFVVGLFGNIIVIYVVVAHEAMRTITNRFIACLSVSDLLICLFAIPFTPINALGRSWILGEAMCKLIPMILTISVFVSTLTSVVIALDRYMVIVHPHTPRMSKTMQILIILIIWVLAASTAIPAGIFYVTDRKPGTELLDCNERWPSANSGIVYTWTVFVLQLIVPAVIITVCYTAIAVRLYQRTKIRLGNTRDREQSEASRNNRINRMLIAMIAIFIICWLPLNIFHLVTSYADPSGTEEATMLQFLFLHIVAMSSVIYNPFLYGWMNENFNKQFRQLGKSILKNCCVWRSKGEGHHALRNGRQETDAGNDKSMQGSILLTVITEADQHSTLEEEQPFVLKSTQDGSDSTNSKLSNYLTLTIPNHE